MAEKFLAYNGHTFNSGTPQQVTFIGNGQYLKESFVLSMDRIIYSYLADGSRASRIEFKGSFKYSANGALSSGTVTDLVTALKFIGNGEGDGELITSYKIASKYSDISNYSFFNSGAPALDGNGIASSVNFFYNSSSTSTQTAPNPTYFPNIYWSNDRNVVDTAIFPIGWWNDPFTLSIGSTSMNTETSTTTALSTTTAVDTLTGTAKKADTFEFSSSPNYNSSADRITNFSTKDKDKVQISSGIFGLTGAGTFKIAKNTKDLTKLLASDTQFIYNKADGGLYFNENSSASGYGNGGIFAILDGKPTLGSSSVSVVA